MRFRPSKRPSHLPPRKHEKFFLWVESRAKRIVVVGMILIVIESGYASWATLHERSERRSQVNMAICSIIRAIPPGNFRIDAVRDQFKCGPYSPPPIPTKPTATPSSSHSIPHHQKPSRTPSPKPSVIIRTQTTFEPGPTYTKKVTKTRTKPGSTKTVTRRPRPPSTSPGLPLPDPICEILPGLCDLKGIP